LWAGASIGQTQIGLVVALALILGVLLALTCAVVFWFVGSSLGSWTKNFPAQPGGDGALPLPVPLPSSPMAPPEAPAPDQMPAKDNFSIVQPLIDKWEGGYDNDPADPGGATNHGITHGELAEWRKTHPGGSIETLSLDEAHQIFRENYWNKLSCDQLPLAVAAMAYNAGVNSGVSRGAKFLQQCLNKQGLALDVDGEIGPLTIAAAVNCDQTRLVNDYVATYEAFYRGISTFPRFGTGWLNRLADFKTHALAWASGSKVVPTDTAPLHLPPWMVRAIALRGLYERSGSADNPVILEMARICGGQIAATYKHDDIAWCALFVNYDLRAAGQPGNDSLWALDFANYGQKLSGPAVGAIACKKRSGGGHVFFVLGRDSAGRLVGIGGNQSDMVCDEVFDAESIVAYTWPKDYPLPAKVGASMTDLSVLPIVTPAPKAHREVELPA